VLFRQFVDEDLGCASYLIGDRDVGVAVVVDPAYAIEQYLETAEEEGVRIERTLETHTHADHLSGHGRLALEHGVPVSVHPLAEAEYPCDPLEDGDELAVGTVPIRVIHTPGHRPEHCAFAVGDELVLTGDSLFVGDTARPDLAVAAVEGAEGLFHSLRRLAELPDRVTVYPGHVAGSLCGASMSTERFSTIGRERAENASFAIPEVSAFVAQASAVSTPRPPNVQRIVALNRGPFVGAPEQVATVELDPGLTVLDVRRVDEHHAGHVRGSLSVPLDGGTFATKAGFVLGADDRIAIDASSGADTDRAARGLRSVGFIDLAGRLVDARRDETSRPIQAQELDDLLAAKEVEIVDVREMDERDAGYIPGTRHVPYRLMRRCAEELAAGGRPLVTICESGARAAIAASVLRAAGIDARPVVGGGIATWRGTTVGFRRCGA
jgi:glyoxylase-like metal-dependent hydrolase (beta-lactamase superfamily II)/rhodanese-related sulfurtransferase